MGHLLLIQYFGSKLTLTGRQDITVPQLPEKIPIFVYQNKAIMIDKIITYNKSFVESKGYEKYLTSKYPDKKLAVLSCMDTRLTELLPAALGLKNGDAKIIKNAGGLVISAFDSAMRSLIVAIYELGVKEIMVVAHSHCGACHMSYSHFHHEMIARGVTDETRHKSPASSGVLWMAGTSAKTPHCILPWATLSNLAAPES